MSEPSHPASPAAPDAHPEPAREPATRDPFHVPRYVDVLLYIGAGVSYIAVSIYNKWLLDWIAGPVWLVAWVWGIPALVRFVRRQPVRPVRPWQPGDAP